MSTILGFQTNHGKKAVVLAGDGCWAHYDEEGKFYKAELGTKFIQPPVNSWTMVVAGQETSELLKFKKRMTGRSAANEFYEQFMTAAESRKPVPQIKKIIETERTEQGYTGAFIISTTSPLELWTMTEKGTPKPLRDKRQLPLPYFLYFSYGLGAEKADSAIYNKSGYPRVTLERVLDLTEDALYVAQDVGITEGKLDTRKFKKFSTGTYTRGYQIAITTEEGTNLSPLYAHDEFTSFRTYCTAVLFGLNTTTPRSAIQTPRELARKR